MCKTEICGLCQHKSWTGCGEHVSKIMDSSDKSGWCTCEPLDAEEAIIIDGHCYPPKAGQGFRRGSSASSSSSTK
ncbi:unnamed protein product [Candida verbasci]|uniref:Uncharacterized protein n=1 Tax=Candida verbasci TaxID=1227364 RepID=A0A9W4TU41_9ASCO|nr:unnamed protein product [Candida verbasci]